jgi:predicted RNase H-like nuclease (RuvC/YqgF family)
MSDFDDMTLETKGSYDTTAYEMKSLKKRIIHMKKKLTVAQQEAKETADLRSEVERLRIECETEKKASLAKDETINRLKKEIDVLRRNQAGVATVSSSPAVSPTHSPPSQNQVAATSVTVTTTTKKKWWQNL